MCPQCYAIYSVTRVRRCHDELRPVKLYATPVVQRNYAASVTRPITQTIRILENMDGVTVVEGADVCAFSAAWKAQEREYAVTPTIFREFEARYDTPIRYNLPTKGVAWNLVDIIERVKNYPGLREIVEQVPIEGGPKRFDDVLILHTAAHLLHRAVSAISGVNEQMLEYWYDVGRQEVVVWERYEGGAGLVEVFIEALRSDPLDVYRELLASVLCPVNLAEGDDWSGPEDLRVRLASTWHLAPDDPLLSSTVQEAAAERQHPDRDRLVCRTNDGCPACIHTTYCTERNEQALTVSRLVGGGVLYTLVQQMDRAALEDAMRACSARDIVPPAMLDADPARDIYSVLVL